MSSSDALDAIRAIVGDKGLITADSAEQYLTEQRGKYHGEALLIVRPENTQEVSDILKIADKSGLKVVPQSGNTGLVGGQLPYDKDLDILLNLSRLNTINEIDTVNDTMRVGAGAILANVQAAATNAGRLFPLSLASEGSAQIGGLLSTNAGGVNVLKYGNAKAQVLGLEVVLANGDIWDGMRALRKDNTGYDLKQLFMGSEGTLGIITSAVLRLFPAPRETVSAFVALDSLEATTALFAAAREQTGDLISAFELLPDIGMDFLQKHMQLRHPLESRSPWYILIELSSPEASERLQAVMEQLLETALETGLINDGAIASNLTQAADFWRLREHLSEVQKFEGGSIKHDIAVKISDIPAFVDRATTALEKACPGIRPVVFGHIGDGNLHFNMSQAEGTDKASYLARWEEINSLVHDIVHSMGGSISAEHGIGLMKRDELAHYKSETEMQMMRALKQALDPKNTLNPGKVV